MINHKTKLQLRAALIKAGGNKKELYRVLLIAEKLGFQWGSRYMYGGGSCVQITDKVDSVAEIIFPGHGSHRLDFNEDYFHPAYIPAEIQYYNNEQLAEIRNEEALYGYEMSHYKIIPGRIGA
jgi:hypothetical protein